MSTASTSVSAKSVQDEILDLANVLEDSQKRLRQLVLRVESQDAETWQSRFEDMEKAHKEAVNSAKWLRAQNAELEQQLGQHKPAIDNALSAREAAFRRLKHARKVIRDLLDERRDMSSPRAGGSLTQEEIDEALYDEFHRDQDSSSSSSDSDNTVRLAPHSPSRDINTPEPSQRSFPVSPSQNVPMNTPLPSGSAGTSITSIQLSPQRPSPRGSPEAMHIHFKKPPGSSVLCAGPLSWEELESSLKLDEDTMNSLQSLSLSKDLSMRLQLVRAGEYNFAFLYDPIFLDTRQRSYILDWGRAQTNTNIERYISRHKGVDLVFHTFIYPLNQKSWFYIGALQWSVAHLTDWWPTFEGASRRKIEKKLGERTLGTVNRQEIGNMLDNKDLKQICVELTRAGDARTSMDFSQTVLGRSPPYAEPRHERRAEGVRE